VSGVGRRIELSPKIFKIKGFLKRNAKIFITIRDQNQIQNYRPKKKKKVQKLILTCVRIELVSVDKLLMLLP
jgi:hypothetical protein